MKRIIYVDKEYRDQFKEESKIQFKISQFLKQTEKFEVSIYLTLDSMIVDVIKNLRRMGKPYDALLTHVPQNLEDVKKVYPDYSHINREDFFSKLYQRSLEVIKEIKKQNPNMPIIAYTGADNNPIVKSLFLQSGIEEVIFKSGLKGLEEDARKIQQALEKCLAI